MTQFYSDESRESDAYTLPDCEVFYRTRAENKEYGVLDGDDKPMPSGWYYWYCFPGCMPESGPMGPYRTEQEALDSAREDAQE